MNTKKRLLILSALVLNNCANVSIHDSEWCGDLGKSGALCQYTFSDRSRKIDYESWEKERFGQVCTEPKSFINWKSSLLKLCKRSGKCRFVESDSAMIDLPFGGVGTIVPSLSRSNKD